jgi:hypothetical protein
MDRGWTVEDEDGSYGDDNPLGILTALSINKQKHCLTLSLCAKSPLNHRVSAIEAQSQAKQLSCLSKDKHKHKHKQQPQA